MVQMRTRGSQMNIMPLLNSQVVKGLSFIFYCIKVVIYYNRRSYSYRIYMEHENVSVFLGEEKHRTQQHNEETDHMVYN